jgi:hypothetical protein
MVEGRWKMEDGRWKMAITQYGSCKICDCEERSNRLVSAIASFLAMTKG